MKWLIILLLIFSCKGEIKNNPKEANVVSTLSKRQTESSDVRIDFDKLNDIQLAVNKIKKEEFFLIKSNALNIEIYNINSKSIRFIEGVCNGDTIMIGKGVLDNVVMNQDKLYLNVIYDKQQYFYAINYSECGLVKEIGQIGRLKNVLYFDTAGVYYTSEIPDMIIERKLFVGEKKSKEINLAELVDENLTFRSSVTFGDKAILDYGIWQGGFINHFYFVLNAKENTISYLKVPKDIFGVKFKHRYIAQPNIVYCETYNDDSEAENELGAAFDIETGFVGYTPGLRGKCIGMKLKDEEIKAYYYTIINKIDSLNYLIEYKPNLKLDLIYYKILKDEHIAKAKLDELTNEELKLVGDFILSKYGYNFNSNKDLQCYYHIYKHYTPTNNDIERLLKPNDRESLKIISGLLTR